MKSIKHITLVNVKGISQPFVLGPLTVITGPNESGKSAILDAITINLLGYHPALGKTATSTMELSSGDTMGVNVLFSDKTSRKAEWKSNGRGGTKTTVPPAIIDDYQVDIAAFQSLKNSDKLNTLFARCKSSEDKWVRFSESTLTGDPDTDHIINRCWGKMSQNPNERISTTVDNLLENRNAVRSSARAADAVLQAWDESKLTAFPITRGLISQTDYATAETEYEKLNHHMTKLLTEKDGIENEVKRRKDNLVLLQSQCESTSRIVVGLRHICGKPVATGPVWTEADDKKLTEQIRCQAEADADIKRITQEKDSIAKLVNLIKGGVNEIFTCPTCGAAAPARNKMLVLADRFTTMVSELSDAFSKAVDAEDDVSNSSKEKQLAALVAKELTERENLTNQLEAAEQVNTYACERYEAAKTEVSGDSLSEITVKIERAAFDLAASKATYLDAKLRMDQTKQVELQSKVRQEKVAESERLTKVAESLGCVCTSATTTMTALVDEAVRELFSVGNSIWKLFDQSVMCVEDGRIGFRRDGKFHSWGCMSGRQKLIATIGLQVALSTGEGRGILLIDEIGRLDSYSTTKLLNQMEALLQGGDLVQVIVSSPNIITAPASATIITL